MIFRWSEGKKYLHGFVAQSRSISFPKSYCSSLLYVGCNICSSQGQWHLLTGVSLPYYHLLLNSVTLQALFLFLLAWMVFSLILLSSSSFTLAPGSTVDPLRSSIALIFCLGFDSPFSSLLYRYALLHYLIFDKPSRLWAISESCIWRGVIYYSRLGGLTSVLSSSWHQSCTKFILICHIPGWYCPWTIEK